MKTIAIENLIQQLLQEQAEGATKVSYTGALMTDNDNSIIITTKNQM